MQSERPETFPWPETRSRLAALLAAGAAEVEEGRRALRVGAPGGALLRFVPPLVLPIETDDPRAYLESLPERLGLHLALLLQAGAAAVGAWRDGRLERHKVLKRYVTRGRCKAQPTYLRTKGKSRYGSRLRLRNHERLLEEVNERLRSWVEELGDPELAFRSCPVRLWADLHRARPAPPLPKERWRKVPLDVRVPSFDELERVYALLGRGRIETA